MRKSNLCYLSVFLIFSGCYGPSRYYPSKYPSSVHKNQLNTAKTSFHSNQSDKEEIFQRLVTTIKSFLGTPYRYGGSSKKGIDCSGLVMKVYQNAVGVHLPHSTTALTKLGVPLSVRNLQFGDLLFFRTSKSRVASHVGIYLYGTKFVHSSSSRGVIISDFSTEKYYRKNFTEARRLMNLW